MKKLKYLLLLLLLVPFITRAAPMIQNKAELILYENAKEQYRIKDYGTSPWGGKDIPLISKVFWANSYDLYIPSVDFKANSDYYIKFKFQRVNENGKTYDYCFSEQPDKRYIDRVTILQDSGNGFKPIQIKNLEIDFKCVDGIYNEINYMLTTKEAIVGKLYFQIHFSKSFSHSSDISNEYSSGEYYYQFLESYSQLNKERLEEIEKQKKEEELEFLRNSHKENKNIFQRIIDVILFIPKTLIDFFKGFFEKLTIDFSLGLSQILEGITKVPKDIIKAIVDIPKNIMNAISDLFKFLFVPSQEFFNTFLKDMGDFFKSKLGFLYTPIDILIQFFEKVKTISSGNSNLAIPEIRLPIFNNVLIQAQNINLKSNILNIFGNYYYIYLNFVDLILWLIFIKFTTKKLNTLLRGIPS